jgi:hypothetical protein
MEALDLVHTLAARGAIAASRVKDFKTSLQKLADASQIPLNELDLNAVGTTYETALETYFDALTPPASQHTQRNTFQNLRQLYRLIDKGVNFPRDRRRTPSTRMSTAEAKQHLVKASPYRTHYNQGPYRCLRDLWPEDIRQNWQRYCDSRALEIRQSTRATHENWFASYVGYNLTIEHPPIQDWSQLFEPERVLRFVTWHAKRVGGKNARASSLGSHVISFIGMLAEHLDRPETMSLRKLQRKLPKPGRLHQTKRPEHTFTLQELDAVGLALIEEGTAPFVFRRGPLTPDVPHPGLRRAVRYQTGLIIRLWVRVPMRSRSIREMDLDGRLYRDEQGQWQLYYLGDQLKIEEQDGDTNEFRIAWPLELVENLETYLREYRPRFPNAETDTTVFLSKRGYPLTQGNIWYRFRIAIYQALRKRIWPHLLRTIWSDAYVDAHPGDYEGAAAMLNNSPAMVQAKYRRFRREQHLQKAIDFNAELFNGHPRRKTP